SWVNIMYYIQDAHSFWDWIYFVFLIIIGSFFMINLCLVVIATQFSETKKRETERMLAERRRFSRSSSTLLSDEPGSCWEETIKYLEHLWKRGHRRLVALWLAYQQKHGKAKRKHLLEEEKRRQRKLLANSSSQLPNHHFTHQANCPLYQITEIRNVPTCPSTTSSISPYSIEAPAASPEISEIVDSGHSPTPPNEIQTNPSKPLVLNSVTPTLAPLKSRHNPKKMTDVTEIICADVNIIPSANNIVEHLLLETSDKKANIQFCECQRQGEISDDDEDDDVEQEEHKHKKTPSRVRLCLNRYIFSYFTRFRHLISAFVASKYFRRIVLSAIVINTLSMGIEYHGQPASLTNALEYSNLVFTSLFAIEMICKIIADGFLKYIKSAYNLFDGIIVVMSVVELQGNKNSGLSVLRTFRLLRVLKLVRFMPTLRRQLVVMLKTMDNVATFFSLLILFIFIFSILGMHLFGGEFCTLQAFNSTSREQIDMKCRCCTCPEMDLLRNHTDLQDIKCIQERKNFDSLRFAVLTVFQVLTQEDWNEVLYNGMEKTSAWAALYFIALMTFGNYVLFNLLVAILVEGFSTEKGSSGSESGSSTDRLAKADPFKTQALLTGDVEVPANPHELVTDDVASAKNSNNENRSTRTTKEVKIMIPKISISNNDDDPTLLMLEANRRRATTVSTPPSPYKSIIKHRPSQPQTPSSTSTTTQSYYTCPTRVESYVSNDLARKSSTIKHTNQGLKKKQSVDENDTENDISEMSQIEDITSITASIGERRPFKRRDTISTTSMSSRHQNILRRQYSLGGRRSSNIVNISLTTGLTKSTQKQFIPHVSTPPPPLPCVERNVRNSLSQTNSSQQEKKCVPIRRTASQRPSTTSSSSSTTTIYRSFIERDGKLIEQEINSLDPTRERRSTFDNSSRRTTKNETSSIYETPKHECEQFYPKSRTNSIRLIADANFNTLSVINDQSDMQLGVKTPNFEQNGLCQTCFSHLCGTRMYDWFQRREDYSLYLFSPTNRLRQALKCLIIKKSFDYTVLFFIALNCITLAMERPSIPSNSAERQFLNMTNYIFTVIFSVEMIIKIIASGLICGPQTYLHTGWNVMDGSLVVISIVDLLTMHRGAGPSAGAESDATTRIFSMLRVFRLLRTLRPLRVISRAPGLKLVVQTLMSSLRPIGHIVVICCTFFIIFGILGVQLFKGKFYYCEGPYARNVTTRQQCEDTPDHRWKNQQYNFDNLGQALLALFVLASRDGWVQIMYNGIDAVDVDMQPIRNYNEAKLI
ncbi:unnamed protein product, partial [Adineta ricciae]